MQVWGFVVYVETHLVCQPHRVHLSSKAQKLIELFFQQFFFFSQGFSSDQFKNVQPKWNGILSGSAFQYLLSAHAGSSSSNCPVKKEQ